MPRNTELTPQEKLTEGEHVKVGWLTARYTDKTDRSVYARFIVSLKRVFVDDETPAVQVNASQADIASEAHVLDRGAVVPRVVPVEGPAGGKFFAADPQVPIRFVELRSGDGACVGLTRGTLPAAPIIEMSRDAGTGDISIEVGRLTPRPKAPEIWANFDKGVPAKQSATKGAPGLLISPVDSKAAPTTATVTAIYLVDPKSKAILAVTSGRPI